MIIRWKTYAVTAIALTLAVFHLYAGGIQIFPSLQQRGIHFGLALALIFLLYPMVKRKGQENHRFLLWFDVLLALASIFIGFYIFVNFLPLSVAMKTTNTTMFVVGILTILITLEASRRIIGWALPVLAIIFLLYALFGERLPLMMAHTGYSMERILNQVGLSTEGIMGMALGVSATYVVLFVVFGTFLEKSGAGKFVIDLAFALVGRFRGGPAKVSVIASALFGSINGYPVANVVTTGVITIPLMKKNGYSSHYAGAVESVASTGGMLLPPVMGAVAFLIADFLQVDYITVALAALIPALLYFIAIFIMIDLRAARYDKGAEKPKAEVIDMKQTIKTKGHLMLPLVVMVYMLVIVQVSPPLAAFWSILSVPLVGLLRKETRMSWKDCFDALKQGIELSLVVAAACACAGIVMGVINMTGIGLRFSGLLVEFSGGSLFMLLLLTMAASIVLGMGLPPVAAYIILAVLAAPAMVKMGVPAMAAHMFIFYYGTLSVITPPVAIASYAASGIAQANAMQTSLTSCRLALVAFIIPFMFVYGPELIFQGTWMAIVISTVTALLGIYSLAIALEGFLRGEILYASRILLFLSSLLLIHVGWMSDMIGCVVITCVLIYELKYRNYVNTYNQSKFTPNVEEK